MSDVTRILIQIESGDPSAAEHLLPLVYEELRKLAEVQIHIPEALDRLIELYTAAEKPDEVTKWQTERAKYPMPH